MTNIFYHVTNLFYFELLDVVVAEIKVSVIVGVVTVVTTVVEAESIVGTKKLSVHS